MRRNGNDMKYDFDKPTERRGTGSVKWDVAPGELPMWIADMDFETAPAVKREIEKTASVGIYGYSTIPDEYFDSISDFWYDRFKYRFSPSDMVYSNGVVAAISSMVRKLTTPGENVLIQPPVYNIFYNSILNNGRNVLTNELSFDGENYTIDFFDLEQKLKNPQTSLMIICNPHNPVGKVWSREELCRIGELCKKYSVTVISDEIHCCITAPNVRYTPFASASDVCADISATCIAASKSFNLAGLQSAAVVAKNPVLRHKIWRGINTDEVGEPNIFSMNANIAAYREGGEWLDGLNEYIWENKKFAVNYLKENAPRLWARVTDATYLLWVNISAYSADSLSFARDLREKTGLYVNDGAEYGPGGEKFIRVNLATQRKNVEAGMKMLAEYVASLEK